VTDEQLVRPVRRIVTGHLPDGRSTVVSDGPSPNSWVSSSVPGFGAVVPWLTEPGEISNAGTADAAPAEDAVPMYPKPGGTILRIAYFPPDTAYSAVSVESLFEEIGGEHAQDAAGEGARHFWFHRTDTLDYGIVLDGEVWLLTDDDERLLRPGDVVIQRGTSHAWSNRSDQMARMAFVLIGALPLTESDS
jgi:hypothetical protein